LLPEALLNEDASNVLHTLFGLEPKKFFVFFAAIEPKKNVGRLIEAFLSSNTPFPLVMIGRKGWLYEDELKPLEYREAKAQLSGLGANRVVFVDYVSFPLLITFMKAARALLFPSLYEGFGLPILEAMMCGTPVMTSNSGSMAEIAAPGTALLIDPLNVREMTAGIEQLASDDELCARLAAAGLARVKDFSWETYRAALLLAYARAVRGTR
jgi:glycosyltransferase involved in cell wall biosynthesis